jgi:hypothetical protein
MAKIRWVIVVILFFLLFIFRNQLQYSGNDFKIATLSDDGITLRLISSERKLMNVLTIGEEVPIWVPKGMGWYQAGRIKKLLLSEKKMDLVNDLFFYNFGFIPDVIILGEPENWINSGQVINKWGWLNYLNYRGVSEEMINRSEVISGDNREKLEEYLNESGQRDFADSRMLREDLRISIYNTSLVGGMANFVAKNLELSGLTVVGIDNFEGGVEKCKLVYGNKADVSYGFEVMKRQFADCQEEKNEKLGENEVELYLGDGFAQMLNYESYKTVNSDQSQN